METATKSSSHAVFDLKLHLVFVTKYRRPCLNDAVRAYLQTAFSEILAAWRCELIEFGGEADHVHLLIAVHPALNLSTLVNNLKTASACSASSLHCASSASISAGVGYTAGSSVAKDTCHCPALMLMTMDAGRSRGRSDTYRNRPTGCFFVPIHR